MPSIVEYNKFAVSSVLRGNDIYARLHASRQARFLAFDAAIAVGQLAPLVALAVDVVVKATIIVWAAGAPALEWFAAVCFANPQGRHGGLRLGQGKDAQGPGGAVRAGLGGLQGGLVVDHQIIGLGVLRIGVDDDQLGAGSRAVHQKVVTAGRRRVHELGDMTAIGAPLTRLGVRHAQAADGLF